MWIFTPDAAHNTDQMETIWAVGGGDCLLHFKYPDREDSIRFLHPASAVNAFDAVMNGIGEGRASVFLREFRFSEIGTPVLKVEYDKGDYETPIKETYLDWVQIDDLSASRKGLITIAKKH